MRNGRTRALTSSAQEVLRFIADKGPETRPVVADALGLSKPTISAAIQDLSALGLVAHVDTAQGATGRTAAVYGLGPRAGFVLGVDVGITRVRVVAADLHGTPFLQRERPRRGSHRTDILAMAASAKLQVAAALHDVGTAHGPLRSVVVGVPHTVNRPVPAGANPETHAQTRIGDQVHRAGVAPDVPVAVENNVNCAAIAEQVLGCAQGHQTFAVVQVGVGIGLAVVSGGQLLVGANGVAGEPAYLPFPWSPDHQPAADSPTALEVYLGADQWMQRVSSTWPRNAGRTPADAAELMHRAQSPALPGHQAARRLVADHARDVGQLAVAVSALLDPGLIILGGGIGSNQILLTEVSAALDHLPWTTAVKASTLGRSATVLGATHMAAATGIEQVLHTPPQWQAQRGVRPLTWEPAD